MTYFSSILKKLSFIIFPSIYWLSSRALLKIHGPFWISQNQDPEYAYLFNSLLLVDGQVPVHIDHPGTPLQLFGALVIKSAFAFKQIFGQFDGEIVQTVLSNPEKYLSLINISFVTLTALVILIIGLFAFHKSNSYLLGYLLQASPFLTTQTFLASSRVSPEPFLFLICQLLVLLFVIYLHNEEQLSVIFYFLFGVLLGIGVATKLTFLPLLALPLAFSGFSKTLITLMSAFGGFVISTIPILSKYGSFFHWMKEIITHTGKYGLGQKGILDFQDVAPALIGLAKDEKLFFTIFVIAGIGLFILLWSWHKQQINKQIFRKKSFRLWLVLVLTFVLQVIITIKHPGAHYLLPTLSLTGLLLYTLWMFSNEKGHVLIFEKVKRRASLLVISITLFAFFHGLQIIKQQSIVYHAITTDMVKIDEFLISHPDIRPIEIYRSSTQEYALAFGNEYSDYRYGELLERLYPNKMFYNIWSGNYYTFNNRALEKDKLSVGKWAIHGGIWPEYGSLKIQGLAYCYKGSIESLFCFTR